MHAWLFKDIDFVWLEISAKRANDKLKPYNVI